MDSDGFLKILKKIVLLGKNAFSPLAEDRPARVIRDRRPRSMFADLTRIVMRKFLRRRIFTLEGDYRARLRELGRFTVRNRFATLLPGAEVTGFP